MKTTFKITDENLYFQTVNDLNLEAVKRNGNTFNGQVSVDTVSDGWKDFTGQHNSDDFEHQYGFVIVGVVDL